MAHILYRVVSVLVKSDQMSINIDIQESVSYESNSRNIHP